MEPSRPGQPGRHQERHYRSLCRARHLRGFTVRVQESDLHIMAAGDLSAPALDALVECRGQLETFIAANPGFLEAMAPWPDDPLAPPVVREMIAAGRAAGVGPMAAVAGAVAEHVGRSLKARTPEVIVENGGDLFIDAKETVTVGVWAGDSPLSMKIGLKVEAAEGGLGVCTSSGTIGHSRSLGQADAACVVARSCALADAAATAIGNLVGSRKDIDAAIDFGRRIEGVGGILVIAGKYMGAWGDIALVPLGA